MKMVTPFIPDKPLNQMFGTQGTVRLFSFYLHYSCKYQNIEVLLLVSGII